MILPYINMLISDLTHTIILKQINELAWHTDGCEIDRMKVR